MNDQHLLDRIQSFGALGMVIVALGVISVLALRGSEEAAGALIAVLAAGTGYFLRGRVESQRE